MRVTIVRKRVNILAYHVECGSWIMSRLENIDNVREPDDLRDFAQAKSSIPKNFAGRSKTEDPERSQQQWQSEIKIRSGPLH
jgi:hypothetical protein